MFSSGAFAGHVSPVAQDGGSPADRAGLTGNTALAALTGGLTACQSADALRAWLSHYAHRHAFRGGSYFHLGHFHAGQRPSSWKLRRYLSTHDDAADLWITDAAQAGTLLVAFLPFAWSAGEGADLSAPQRTLLGAQQLDAVAGGVTIPVQDHAAGPACLVLFGGAEQDAVRLVDAEAPSLAVAALAFHLLARTILPPSNALEPALSDREIACLRLAASGESLTETAGRLGVSVRTVELHVGRASRKLSAVNKIHAVALAASAGLIQV